MKRSHLIGIIFCLVAFTVAVRLSPHLPNMTPVTALAFVGSLYLGRRAAILMPLLALLLSDFIVGFYDWRIMLSVYGSFAVIGVMSWAVRGHRAVLPIGLSVIGASLLFFIVTNGAVWAFSPWYEKSISGLLYAYELGLPFLRNMLVGDIAYTAALVAMFEVAHSRVRTRCAIVGA